MCVSIVYIYSSPVPSNTWDQWHQWYGSYRKCNEACQTSKVEPSRIMKHGPSCKKWKIIMAYEKPCLMKDQSTIGMEVGGSTHSLILKPNRPTWPNAKPRGRLAHCFRTGRFTNGQTVHGFLVRFAGDLRWTWSVHSDGYEWLWWVMDVMAGQIEF